MERDEVEVHKLAKKERGQYPATINRTNLVNKGFITWAFREILLAEIQQVVPSGQDGSILLARVANHSARFGSSCRLAELAI